MARLAGKDDVVERPLVGGVLAADLLLHGCQEALRARSQSRGGSLRFTAGLYSMQTDILLQSVSC